MEEWIETIEEARAEAYRSPCCGDEVLVARDDCEAVTTALRTCRVDSVPVDPGTGIVRLRVPEGTDVAAVLAQVRESVRTRRAGREPRVSLNRRMVQGQPNTSGNPTGAAKPTTDRRAPRLVSGRSPVTVGIVDTGIVNHEWLSGAFLATPDDFETDLDRNLDRRLDLQAGHGTFLAGLVLAHAPEATVRVKRVLDSDGNADEAAVAQAILELVDAGVDVINLSLGCYTEDDEVPWALRHAVDAVPPNVAVVAAAGNFRSRRKFWPAALERVVAVGAIDRGEGSSALADFTNQGDWVDTYTNGVNLMSTFLNWDGADVSKGGKDPDEFHGWARWDGTSFAAACLSGAIAERAALDGVSAAEAARTLIADVRPEPLGRALPPEGPAGDPVLGIVLDLKPVVGTA